MAKKENTKKEMVTRTFIEETTLEFKPVVDGVTGEAQTVTVEGRASDPVKVCKKAASLGKYDSVIIVGVQEKAQLLGMPVEDFKALAKPIEE